MQRIKVFMAAASIGLTSVSGGVHASDPDGFNDCILEHVTGEMSGQAASVIRSACARKHDVTIYGEPYKVGIQPDSRLRQVQRENPRLNEFSDRKIFEAMKERPEFQYLSDREKRIAITGSLTPFPDEE